MQEQTQQGTAEQLSTERNDLVLNTSLIITALDEEQDNNEQQINFMERFIHDKQTEVANLQTFLLTELQNMENCRTNNKRMQRIMVTDAIPTLAIIKNSLQSIKMMMSPICQTAANFIEMLAQRSRSLLLEKQEECRRQRKEIECLNKTINAMRKEKDQLRGRIEEQKSVDKKDIVLQINKGQQSNSNKKQIKYRCVEETPFQIQQISPTSNHTSPLAHHKSKPKFNPMETQQSTSPCFGKTDNQRSKYQQCYNYIQENKKTIQYRCERTAMGNLPINIRSSQSLKKDREQVQKCKQNCVGQRKQYIKEKIKQIKIKAECRQNRKQSPLNDKKKH